jgi:hypothetical protein
LFLFSGKKEKENHEVVAELQQLMAGRTPKHWLLFSGKKVTGRVLRLPAIYISR